MPKLRPRPPQTFKAKATIPLPGGGKEEVVLTFRHRSRDQLNELAKRHESTSAGDVDYVMEACEGWEYEEPFTRESVAEFLQDFGGAAAAITFTYTTELLGLRAKN